MCVKEGKALHILLNAEYSKNEDDVIETVAHELAHQDYPNQHNKEWKKRRDAILKELKTLMKA